MLCKHYFPNQQTPFLGRKIRYVVAILEEGSQGARSPWHSFGVVWDPLLDYWGGVFWSGVSGCFRVLVFFVLFSTGTASRLAPKSCWALLDFISVKHANCKAACTAQMWHPKSCLLPFLQVMASWARREAACSGARGVSGKVALNEHCLKVFQTKLPLKTACWAKNNEWC